MSAFVYMDFAVGGEPVGRVVFELFDDTPLTSANFRALCKGDKPTPEGSVPLTFKDSNIHRIVRNFAIQGGDIVYGDGTGGTSIYGDQFDDENFVHNHAEPFVLSMANAGPNSNKSQFFVTLKGSPHLDGKHVAFGKVVAGKSVLRQLEELDTAPGDVPVLPVTITNCGELKRDAKLLLPFIGSQDGLTADKYEEHPDDNFNVGKEEGELNFDDPEQALRVTLEIKAYATEVYKMAGDAESEEERAMVLRVALQKYKKALRYVFELSPDPDSSKKAYDEFQKAKLALHQNMGLVALQLKKYDQVINSTTSALEMECATSRDRAKALSRRSSAYQGLKKQERAINDLEQAHELLPSDPQISKSLTALKQESEMKEKKQKAQYAKFFS
ncbi:cyclophilin-like domain-containing protein [Yarrowia lipolytica]|jgi:peptidyl-prolyl isomerase D|uniref:peptidylprolyl isomerase n=1 Tax=Yarrowia lipolytica TaxID=4952 RepID=A0A371C3W2_YARLL|nr:Peptidyl-prolyl cis-trans isomerase D [Yarrowia lipolytica]RDW24996.1 cyclophilin-like domain-containing protein [Yarrowia lipolytica]RDW31736.1 cyclophilin-like domain-containing protein [Yarrowia lipolytica]RDW38606.1 cyclophilin-like domain-containing protein [Yarrowia lipolytica]RDW43891.1 cyclophilin-like domain-containing protein [Yarrowia lipolytica]